MDFGPKKNKNLDVNIFALCISPEFHNMIPLLAKSSNIEVTFFGCKYERMFYTFGSDYRTCDYGESNAISR